jgi:deazaflavin-dependent oxidoreductase (nitroreductase family)
MIVTTAGRKSGEPRRTALGFNELHGRKYVFTLRGPVTDWYRNMLADPHVTIQTAGGSESVVARRVRGDEELGDTYEFLARIPVMRRWAAASREALIAHKDDLILITFAPTAEQTPPPLRADLTWVWPVLVVLGSILLLGVVL